MAEAINDGQFLTTRLTRDQCRRAIEGPATVYGGSVDSALVTTLLNETGDNPDQLPLLQHALMRLWDAAWTEEHEGEIRLTLDAYQRLGGHPGGQSGRTDLRFSGALSRHADEILERLSPEQQRLAQTLFRCLTEGEGAHGRDVRRPTTLGDVAAVAGAAVADLVSVVESFRAPGRHFLMPPVAIRLGAETTIDITHESLIRQWTTLGDWVREETRSAEIYRRLEGTANLWQNHQAELWTGADLASALAWKERERPNAAWAARYGDDFVTAMQFLDESAAAERRRLAEADAARQLAARAEADRRHAHRMRWAVSVAVLLAFVAVGFAFWAYRLEQDARVHEQAAVEARERLVTDRQDSSGREIETALGDGKVELARIIARGAVEATGRPAGRLQRAMSGVFLAQGQGPLLVGTDGETKFAVVDPKGRYVAGAIANGNIALWDSASGSVIRSLAAQGGDVTALALSPDGERLGAGFHDGSLRVWEALSGRPLRIMRGDRSEITTIAFVALGDQLLSGSRGGTIRRWQLDQTGALDEILAPSQSSGSDQDIPVTAVASNPSGSLTLAANHGGTITVWKGTSAVLERKLSDPITQVAFSTADKGNLALLASDENMYILRTDDAGKFDIVDVPQVRRPRELSALQFDPTAKKFVVAMGRTTVKISDAMLGRRLYDATSAPINWPGDIVALEPTARWTLLRAPNDDKLPLQLISATVSPERTQDEPTPDQRAESRFLAASNDRVAIGVGNVLRLIASGTGDKEGEVSITDDIVCGAFDKAGDRLALGLENGKVAVIKTDDRGITISSSGHEGKVLSISFSSDPNRLVTGSADETAIVWALDNQEPKPLLRLRGHSDWVRGAAFSADDVDIVSISDDGTLRLWDAGTGEQRTVDKVAQDFLLSLSLDHSGRRALLRVDGRPSRIWDLEKRSLTAVLPVADPSAATFFGSADDLVLASRDGRVTLWSSNADELIGITKQPEGIALADRGRELVDIAPSGSVRFGSVEPNLVGTDWTAVIAAGSTRAPTPEEQANYGWRLTMSKGAPAVGRPPPCAVAGTGENACLSLLKEGRDSGEGWFDWSEFREGARGTDKSAAPTPDPRLVIAAAIGYPPALERLGDWFADPVHRYSQTAQALYIAAATVDHGEVSGLFRWMMQNGDDVRIVAESLRPFLNDRATAGDAASHAVLGALAERSKDDRQSLGEAFYHYAIAVRLAGDLSDHWIQDAWVRQGALARVLGPREAAERWHAAQGWAATAEKLPQTTKLRPPVWRPDLHNRNLAEETEVFALAIEGIDYLPTTSSNDVGLGLLRAEEWSRLAGLERVNKRREAAIQHLSAARRELERQRADRIGDRWFADRLSDVLGGLTELTDPPERYSLLAAKIDLERQQIDVGADDREHKTALGDDELEFAIHQLDEGDNAEARAKLEDALLRFSPPSKGAEWSETQQFVAHETKIADAFARLSDVKAALAAYGRALAWLDPAVDVDVDAHYLNDDKAAALASVQQSIIGLIHSGLGDADLVTVFSGIDYGFNQVGKYYVKKEDVSNAVRVYSDALEIRAWLVRLDPQQAKIWRQISVGYGWFPGWFLQQDNSMSARMKTYKNRQHALNAANQFFHLNDGDSDSTSIKIQSIEGLYYAATDLDIVQIKENFSVFLSLLRSANLVHLASSSSEEATADAASSALLNFGALEGRLMGDQGLTAEDGSPCDRAVGSPYDPQRRSKGVRFDDIVSPLDAVSLCLDDDPVTLYELGRANDKAGKYEAAFYQYRSAAKLGHLMSISNLAQIYSDHDIEHKLSLKFFREAQLRLGGQLARRFISGEGLPDDPETAMRLLESVAEWGDSDSHRLLSKLYAEGKIVPQDFGRSLYHGIVAARLLENNELEQYLRTADELPIDMVERVRQETAAYAWKPRPDPLSDFDRLPPPDVKKQADR